MQTEKILLETFGYNQFRKPQKEIITQILNKKDCLAILPTGAGKSLCYQLPSQIFPGLTIVVTPLISLMKDQVDKLNKKNIGAEYIDASKTFDQMNEIYRKIQYNKVKILYVSPERLENEYFQNHHIMEKIDFIAIDEAHSISKWGHSFRPSYRRILEFIENLDTRPVIGAFTATATKKVQMDIIDQLNMNSPAVYVNSFDRPNIRFEVKEPIDKIQYLKETLDNSQSTIIYASTRNNVETVYNLLKESNLNIGMYHGGMSYFQRKVVQDAFLSSKINILVATNAFGMGIDKKDIRRVIHYNMPNDLESYYQEAGRAGRDGKEAIATLLFTSADISTSVALVEMDNGEKIDPKNANEKIQQMIAYCKTNKCLRKYILNYFGEDTKEKCDNCSNCLNEFVFTDATVDAQKILSCIYRMKVPFGKTMVSGVLRGSNAKKLKSWGFHRISTYNIMDSSSDEYIKDVIDVLIAKGYIDLGRKSTLRLNNKSKEVLTGKKEIYVRKKNFNKRKRKQFVKDPNRTYKYQETLKLYKEGVDLEEIANKRQVRLNTVLNDLKKAIMNKELDKFVSQISKEKKDRIENVLDDGESKSFRDIKSSLPEEISYDDIWQVFLERMTN